MLKFGHEYADQGMQHYEDRFLHQQIEGLHKRPPNSAIRLLKSSRCEIYEERFWRV